MLESGIRGCKIPSYQTAEPAFRVSWQNHGRKFALEKEAEYNIFVLNQGGTAEDKLFRPEIFRMIGLFILKIFKRE
ncbi:hypothetical protein B4064_3370 [Caldibacillus thermoamylovorans]|uniref:hypothetical protein n=1 Tax=Caldibacillus thermoamylovorans TaxID=35841 RepID=UPI0005A45F14|nr:hypothetical protein [Caldibacillus thermoamylovorans]KIO61985.1 hypothetical protein B4064_3370 [Caldibacillus thermoamylovorans]